FQPERVVTARITPTESFCADSRRCVTFYRSLIDQLQSEPGVSGSALVNTLPLGGRIAKRSIEIEGYVAPPEKVSPLWWLNIVTPDYFRVMSMATREGSAFTYADEADAARPVVITAATARRFWPDSSAVGRHIRFVGEQPWRTVVGVTSDIRAYDLQR